MVVSKKDNAPLRGEQRLSKHEYKLLHTFVCLAQALYFPYFQSYTNDTVSRSISFFFFFFFQSMLFDYAGFFFVPLSSRLVNDDSASCRKLTALVIKSLLGKVLTRSENNVRRVCRCSSR